MPSKQAVIIILLITVLFAGCVSSPQSSPADTPTSTLTERPTPEQPPNPDDDTALEYVTSYERAVVYNRILDSDTREIGTDCQSALLNETSDGYLVRAACGASEESGSGDSAGGGGYLPIPATYLVTDERTVRIQPTDTPAPREFSPQSDAERLEYRTGFELMNFADSQREVRVEIVYSGPDGQVPVLNTSYTLDARSGVNVVRLTDYTGVYSVTIESGDTRMTTQWSPDNDDRPNELVVMITDSEIFVNTSLPRLH